LEILWGSVLGYPVNKKRCIGGKIRTIFEKIRKVKKHKPWA
jgi:hypothetical protein